MSESFWGGGERSNSESRREDASNARDDEDLLYAEVDIRCDGDNKNGMRQSAGIGVQYPNGCTKTNPYSYPVSSTARLADFMMNLTFESGQVRYSYFAGFPNERQFPGKQSLLRAVLIYS